MSAKRSIFANTTPAAPSNWSAAQEVHVPGEENRFIYIPRGVAAVIAPWNFPLAILTGMTTAALATGNTVIMKPAEQSSVIAAKLMEIFNEIDLPPGVAQFLPGKGEVVGAALVEHPDVALIAFTGSRAVGLAINAKAAEVSKRGIGYVKHAICEMGGKNAIIVDDDADLDEAVLGVVKSAFGYQGQKCSACSRCIVLASVYDGFIARLVEATRSLKIGPADDPATSVGPVIDSESMTRVKDYIELGRREAREVLSVDVGELAKQGYFIGPHIFADVQPNSRLAQEEIFGPVLAIIRAADLTEAIGHRQWNGICANRRHLFPQPGAFGSSLPRVSGWKSLPQSADHRRFCGPAAVRWIQAFRHRQQSRRARLFAPICVAADDYRKHASPRVCATQRRARIGIRTRRLVRRHGQSHTISVSSRLRVVRPQCR